MGILLESVKNRKKIRSKAPVAVKRQIVLDELKAMNVTESRAGEPIDTLDYARLKEEWVIASILWVDVEHSDNKWY